MVKIRAMLKNSLQTTKQGKRNDQKDIQGQQHANSPIGLKQVWIKLAPSVGFSRFVKPGVSKKYGCLKKLHLKKR